VTSLRTFVFALCLAALGSTTLAGCGKCQVAKDCPGAFCDQETGKCISLCRSDLDCPSTAHCNTQIGNCSPELIQLVDGAMTSTTGRDASSADRGDVLDSTPADTQNGD
jgi:hypothetical protein